MFSAAKSGSEPPPGEGLVEGSSLFIAGAASSLEWRFGRSATSTLSPLPLFLMISLGIVLPSFLSIVVGGDEILVF
jgi:hypothetical protein